MSIAIRNVSKKFGSFTALHDVSLTIPDGELVALLGPSGSGKTTLLRIISGLELPDTGSIALQGRDATHDAPQQRQVGFVFQHYALFRHMSVLDNVAFGLQVRPKANRPSPADIRARAHDLLKLVQLDGYADRKPSQLSGGQRQRIALARALAVEPKVLLLDEPFGALDAQVRRELRRWLRQLHDKVGLTSVFVTHDQEEALEVADRVVVFSQGRIEQVGTPNEVYHHPATPFVHRFLGNINVFHGRDQTKVVSQGDVVVYVRPHDVTITRNADADHTINATIVTVAAAGPVVRLELTRNDNGAHVEAQLSHAAHRNLDIIAGDSVYIGYSHFGVYPQEALTA